jgi:hypothetical protein
VFLSENLVGVAEVEQVEAVEKISCYSEVVVVVVAAAVRKQVCCHLVVAVVAVVVVVVVAAVPRKQVRFHLRWLVVAPVPILHVYLHFLLMIAAAAWYLVTPAVILVAAGFVQLKG